MRRSVAIVAVLCLAGLLPLAARGGTGVLQVDDHWYPIDLDAAVAWRHDQARVELPTAVISGCQRAGGGAPLAGATTVAVGNGPQLLFTDLPIRLAPSEPHVLVRSVSGDVVCTGGTLSPIMLRDGFE